MNKSISLEVILPVYNEGKNIKRVVKEIYTCIASNVSMRFIVSENGSTDNTKQALRYLSRDYPIYLLFGERRKGYSKSMIDAMKCVRAPYVLCVDSDSQYSPKDFWKLWYMRKSCDIVVGYRKRRADPLSRRIMSWMFYMFFRGLFPKNIHDPSSSFVLIRRSALQRIVPILGLTNEGFWWEFTARARQYGFIVHECEVEHKPRFSGKTKVYSARDLPRIAYTHAIAMIQIGLSGLVKK